MERPGQQMVSKRLTLLCLVVATSLGWSPLGFTPLWAQQDSPREGSLDVPVRVPGPPREGGEIAPVREPTPEPRQRVALLFLAGPELASQVPDPAAAPSATRSLPLIELAVREVRPYVTSLSSRTDLAFFLVT